MAKFDLVHSGKVGWRAYHRAWHEFSLASLGPMNPAARVVFHEWIKSLPLTGAYELAVGFAIVDLETDRDAALVKLSFDSSIFEEVV